MADESGQEVSGIQEAPPPPQPPTPPEQPHPYATAASTKPPYLTQTPPPQPTQTPEELHPYAAVAFETKPPSYVHTSPQSATQKSLLERKAEAGEMPGRTGWSSEVSAGQKAARSESKRGQSLERRKQVLREWDSEAIRPTQTAPQEQPTQTAAVSTSEYPTPPPALSEEERLRKMKEEAEVAVLEGQGIPGRGLPPGSSEQQAPQETQKRPSTVGWSLFTPQDQPFPMPAAAG